MLDDETTSHIVLEESAKITNKIMCCSAATAVQKGDVGGGVVVCFADQLLLRSPFSSHSKIHQAGNFGIFGPDNALGSQ